MRRTSGEGFCRVNVAARHGVKRPSREAPRGGGGNRSRSRREGAGAVGSPPAVINALVDALADSGITTMDMPATPETVWKALATAKKAA